MKLEEMYPEGRTFYYEGTLPEAFINAMRALGLEANVTITVHVPARLLHEVQRSWPVGT